MRTLLGAAAGLLALVTAATAADPPAAVVGGRTITMAELEKYLKPRLIEIEQQRYETLLEGLDELITSELYQQEAKARGITPEALQKELSDKVPAPTDAEVQKVYDDNKHALKDATFEDVKPRIVEYLKQQKIAETEDEYLDGLRKKYKAVVNIQPPKIEIGTGGRPERGPKDAPITIIEFSDYECPFCKQAEATVQKVLKTYGNQVRFVYRDFPLEIHPNARAASEAAHCAQAQGKFWEYHDKLMAAEDVDADKLKSMADEVKLDRAKFDECVAKQQFKAAVDKDIADGTEIGVTGTPAFFINGRMLAGAEPFERFQEIIDEELARLKKDKSS